MPIRATDRRYNNTSLKDSRDRQKPERVGEIAAKAVVQPARKAAGGWRGTARCGVAQQRGVIRAHFFQLAGRPYRPSVAHSQRGGFAADYLGAIRNLQMITATLARARCSVFTRSTWETSTAVPGQSARANMRHK
jgi:hypothetical protein